MYACLICSEMLVKSFINIQQNCRWCILNTAGKKVAGKCMLFATSVGSSMNCNYSWVFSVLHSTTY